MTILEEGITTIIMAEYLKLPKKDYENKDKRKEVSAILSYINNPNNKEIKENHLEIEKKLLEFENLKEITEIHENIKNIRNDINHAGFRNSPMKASNFLENLKKNFSKIKKKLKINNAGEEKNIEEKIEKKALLLFSHQLTEKQEKELKEDIKVENIISLPNELQEMWSNVSIYENYEENIEKIKKFIRNNFNEKDVMLIQGNWGYTYNLVKWSIENEFLPVYSYTERNVEEIKDGENVKKISYFKHVKFIRYE